MSRAARWRAVRAAHWSRPAEDRASSALLLAAHELRSAAEAAEARGGDAELAADCVFWTTLVSCATITGWLIVLRMWPLQ